MRKLLLLLSVVHLLIACRHSPHDTDSEILVKVYGYSLSRKEVEAIVPKDIPPSDSLLIAENFVKKWIKDMLTYEVAVENLGKDEESINKLVEDYRRTLLRHRYQDHLLRSRLSDVIPEDEKKAFYEEHRSRFVLDRNLVKGLFLKIPANAPGLNDVRKWARSNTPESLENIEKYSIQNAAIYDYFYDKWVDFEEILDKMPVSISDKAGFLRTNSFVERTDSVYFYFLNISEYLVSGNTVPYEYADAQIREMILNKRKIDLLRTLEEDLYREAVRKGDVVFYTNLK